MANRADQRKFHYIYKITRNDGKYYIGMHSTDDLEDGYFGSGQLLWKSIKKYGKEKHTKDILEFLSTRQELKLREKALVNKEILNDPLCMNLQLGGEGGGGFWSKDQQLKCSRAGGLARASWTEQGKQNLANAARRTQRIAQAASNSATAVAKRKATFANRNHQAGINNSQFGTCWVSNSNSTIKIKIEMLEHYLSMGYSRGRKQI